ncbi:uncharacterized protein LOC110464014 [Mizuhopecten yessoensis]|uniref:uncharacterized protein LOC110464014 n=1 Tax=Mizuhopecten yessoensis TaxID=6573 RepID=UPI000B45EDE1|nr:uncharacterized protein LOC110464014 [Mizuhopecten yessoensis]
MATSLYKGQIPSRTKGQTTCFHHKGRQLDIYCEECQELACTKCLSTVHKKHPLCDLSEINLQKKQDIQTFINKTEKADMVQIDKFITATDEHLKDNASNFEKLSHQLKTQTNKLKHDLDLFTTQTLSLYQQMDEDNTKLLQTYKQDLEMYSTQLKQQVQECKIALQRGSDIQIYDTGCEVQFTVPLPVKPTLSTASFISNQNHQAYLEQALGILNISGQGHGQALLDHHFSVGSSAGQGPLSTQHQQHQSNLKVRASSTQQKSEPKEKTPSTQQRSERRKDVTSPVYTLLAQTKVLGEWESPWHITSVCPITDGQVWTSYFCSNTLTLLDRKGKVIQEVTHNTRIIDISLSPKTNTLWVCDKENNITELVSGRLVHRFSTRQTPQCICITASNHVLVGMVKYISKFTTKGTLVHTTLSAGTRKALVCRPYRISECPVTHNVAVTDKDSKDDGGEGKPHVVVMDTDFKELFVYDGEVPHTYQPTSQSGGEPFSPRGVVYDSVGNLVIVDSNNNRILLISGRGEFLRFIQTGDNPPQAVGVDREDVMWAAFGFNNVKILQYSSV